MVYFSYNILQGSTGNSFYFQNLTIFTPNLTYVTNYTYPNPQPPNNITETCQNLSISQDPYVPFLYCLSQNYLWITNLYSIGNQSQLSTFQMIPANYGINWSNPSITLSKSHPTFIFLKTSTTVYIIDVFALLTGWPNPIVGSIVIPTTLQSGSYQIAIGTSSLVMIKVHGIYLYEYDISYPINPVLIKTVDSGYTYFAIAGDSQTNTEVMIYGSSGSNQQILLYKTGVMGNANFFTYFPLNVRQGFTGLYNSFEINGTHSIFAYPNATQMGWMYNFKTIITCRFSASDPNINSDDELEVFAINPLYAHALQESIFLQITQIDIPVIALAAYYYNPAVLNLQANAFNNVSFDPRILFNGPISNFTFTPDSTSDNFTIYPQQIGEVSDDLMVGGTSTTTYSIYINGLVYIQSANSLSQYNPATQTTSPIWTYPSQNSICDLLAFNLWGNVSVSGCFDPSISLYTLTVIKYNAGAPLESLPIQTVSKSVKKVVVTANNIWVLETSGVLGSLIAIYGFTDPLYPFPITTLSSGDFGTHELNAEDMDLNYQGASSGYRIYVADRDYGPRFLDVNFVNNSGVITVTLGQNGGAQLPVATNIEWNGIKLLESEGSFQAGNIYAVITSKTSESYVIYYNPGVGSITILQTLYPIASGNTINICSASGFNFVLNQVNSSGTFAVYYTISNVSGAPSSQSYPFFSLYSQSIDSKYCLLSQVGTLNNTLYYSGTASTLPSYSVNPNVTFGIQGLPQSQYMTILASSPYGDDTALFYFSAPPSGGSSGFWVKFFIIMGVVVVVIIAIAFIYCIMKCRRNRANTEKDSIYSEDLHAILASKTGRD